MTDLGDRIPSPPRLAAFGLVLVLAVVGALVARGERRLATGRTAFLAIAPPRPAPRSPLQGDGVVLVHDLGEAAAQARAAAGDWPDHGRLVVALDDRGVATYRRRHVPGVALDPDEALLEYRTVRGRGIITVAVGADIWRHQEGQAETYAQARYAEYRLSPEGTAILVALRDQGLAVVGRPRGRW